MEEPDHKPLSAHANPGRGPTIHDLDLDLVGAYSDAVEEAISDCRRPILPDPLTGSVAYVLRADWRLTDAISAFLPSRQIRVRDLTADRQHHVERDLTVFRPDAVEELLKQMGVRPQQVYSGKGHHRHVIGSRPVSRYVRVIDTRTSVMNRFQPGGTFRLYPCMPIKNEITGFPTWHVLNEHLQSLAGQHWSDVHLFEVYVAAEGSTAFKRLDGLLLIGQHHLFGQDPIWQARGIRYANKHLYAGIRRDSSSPAGTIDTTSLSRLLELVSHLSNPVATICEVVHDYFRVTAELDWRVIS